MPRKVGVVGGGAVFLQPLLSFNALSLSKPRGGAPTPREDPICPGCSSGSSESHETPRGGQHPGVSDPAPGSVPEPDLGDVGAEPALGF